jgi:uncharacterized membrane protein YecN with MAPEG domain
MSAVDLIVVAPWLLFGAGLALIGARLMMAGRLTRRDRRRREGEKG